jgi:HlyD family secretion protein
MSEGGTVAKPGRRKLLWIALMASATGAAVAGYLSLFPIIDQPEVPVVTAAPVPAQVTALGEVLPVTNLVTVAAPTGQDAGRIAEIRVAEAATVKAGDVLAVLDTEPLLRAELAQARANEAVRRAAVASRTADLDATEAQLAAQVDQLEVALEKAQTELDRMTRLRDSGLYEDAALIDRRLDVQSASFNLLNTEIQLDRNRARSADGLRLDEASARAELDAAIAARQNAEASYAKAFVKAPISGRVIALFGRVGQQIGSDGFALIGDTSQMTVRAEVYESDITGIAIGQEVEVTSRALGRALAGKVDRIGVRIAEQSILSTDPAAIVDARVIEVWIHLDETSSLATQDLSGLQVLVSFAPPEGSDA